MAQINKPFLLNDIFELIEIFSSYDGYPSHIPLNQLSNIQDNLFSLFNLDYDISIIHNENSEICSTYPPQIILIEGEKNKPKVNDISSISSLISSSQYARVRQRAVVPVILFEKYNICRSSTLSVGAECIFNQGVVKAKNYISSWYYGGNGSILDFSPGNFIPDKFRVADHDLLQQIGVNTLCDLMVENQKKILGVNCCSSEKIDFSGHYNNFEILVLPYPGCEFFSIYKDNNHICSNIYYDWNAPNHDVKLSIDQCSHKDQIMCVWDEWNLWPLSQLTLNYLKLLLKHILDTDHSTGILIHCISGWDRTCIFVSLIRIILWAAGYIHHSLNSIEILYLTIAYDWILFAHQFPNRCLKGEDVFYFTFNFLQYLTEFQSIFINNPPLSSHLSQSPTNPIPIPHSHEQVDSEYSSSASVEKSSWEKVSDLESNVQNLLAHEVHINEVTHILSPVAEVNREDSSMNSYSNNIQEVRSLFLEAYQKIINPLEQEKVGAEKVETPVGVGVSLFEWLPSFLSKGGNSLNNNS